jgi:Baseplate J-like protein
MSGADLTTSRSSPVVDYTTGDFDGFKADLIAYAQAKFPDRWTDFNDDQIGVALLETECYGLDLLNYQLNSSLRELFVPTVLRRQNLIYLGRPYDFEPTDYLSATVDLEVTLDPAGTYPFTLEQDNQFSNGNSEGDEIFFSPSASSIVAAYTPTISVECIEGERWTNQPIGVSNGTPNQRWQLPQDAVIPDSISVLVGAEQWTKAERNNLNYSASTAKNYRIITTDDRQSFIVFGDGVYGQIPSLGTSIYASFRVGGGKRGNLNAGTIETLVSTHPNIVSVTNPARSSGGDDPQSMRSAKNAIPASLRTLERAVTESDHVDLALQVAGVAKARVAAADSLGSRIITLIIAPIGGGQPSLALKNAVIAYFKDRKMVTSRVRSRAPIYRDLRLSVLLHVNASFRTLAVKQAVRQSVTNVNGTGLLDFAQLDFAAVAKTSEGGEELLLAQTRLQGFFDRLAGAGLDRAEITQCDIIPIARPRLTGNVGTGDIPAISLSGRQRRREFHVEVTSASTYRVYERIIGRVTSLTDTTLGDDTKNFDEEGINDYAGYRLTPSRESSLSVNVTSASGQEIQTNGGTSLFALTSTDSEYFLFAPNPPQIAIGDEYVSSDSAVRFTLTDGATPFINGDSFFIDVFPTVGDIRLRDDEYPVLSEVNFITRTSGGARV